MLRPFNVVIRKTEVGVVVEMLNPEMMVQITENDDVARIANEVTDLLAAALASLK